MTPRSASPRILGWLAVIAAAAGRPLFGQNRVEYKYENYQEDDHRVNVQTHGIWFE